MLYGLYSSAPDPALEAIRSWKAELTATPPETLVEPAEETKPTTDEISEPEVLDLAAKVRARVRLQDSYELVDVPLSFGLKKKLPAPTRVQRIPESIGNILGG